MYDGITIRAMLKHVENIVADRIGNRGLVIALDEAHVAAEYILANKLIAPSAVNKGEEELLDDNLQLKRGIRRGFLTPLCAALSSMRATLVILGTSLSLSNPD